LSIIRSKGRFLKIVPDNKNPTDGNATAAAASTTTPLGSASNDKSSNTTGNILKFSFRRSNGSVFTNSYVDWMTEKGPLRVDCPKDWKVEWQPALTLNHTIIIALEMVRIFKVPENQQNPPPLTPSAGNTARQAPPLQQQLPKLFQQQQKKAVNPASSKTPQPLPQREAFNGKTANKQQTATPHSNNPNHHANRQFKIRAPSHCAPRANPVNTGPRPSVIHTPVFHFICFIFLNENISYFIIQQVQIKAEPKSADNTVVQTNDSNAESDDIYSSSHPTPKPPPRRLFVKKEPGLDSAASSSFDQGKPEPPPAPATALKRTHSSSRSSTANEQRHPIRPLQPIRPIQQQQIQPPPYKKAKIQHATPLLDKTVHEMYDEYYDDAEEEEERLQRDLEEATRYQQEIMEEEYHDALEKPFDEIYEEIQDSGEEDAADSSYQQQLDKGQCDEVIITLSQFLEKARIKTPNSITNLI
jgi:hypothetical protein